MTGYFLVKESYQYNGRLSINGDLSNNINKYYPDLIYNHKPHALTNRHCRVRTQSKEASIKKIKVEFKRNETLQVTHGHTMIYYSFCVTLTGSEFFSASLWSSPSTASSRWSSFPLLPSRIESWMREIVQEWIKHKQDQPAH